MGKDKAIEWIEMAQCRIEIVCDAEVCAEDRYDLDQAIEYLNKAKEELNDKQG